MPRVGFEPRISLLKWAKMVHALDRTATVIGYQLPRKEYSLKRPEFFSCSRNYLSIWNRKIHYYFHNSLPLIHPKHDETSAHCNVLF
jgi:hypothetical protein